MASSLRARFSSHVLRADPDEPRLERKKITVAGKTHVQYCVRPGRERDYVIERRQRRYQSREELTEASTSRARPLPILDTAQHGMSSAAGTERGERYAPEPWADVSSPPTCRFCQNTADKTASDLLMGWRVRTHVVSTSEFTATARVYLVITKSRRRTSVAMAYEPISGREREDHLDKTPNRRHRFTGTIHQEKEDSLFAQKLHELELGGGGRWELDTLQWDDLADDKTYIDEHGPGQGTQADATAAASKCSSFGSGREPTPLWASGSAVGVKTAWEAIHRLGGDEAIQGRDLQRRVFSQDLQVAELDDAPPPYSLHAT
ncbi:hypothetical protein GGTG_12632 [Gaeumannomyces tritici R3-111a-1]|uniref:Uncharacterized protein n=1 Tax=Gaeumannomyces tritici (strain R3-111a-1) TaxID=644352 RepID=J3PGK3_GAET3|nr:hypothetical protein GGTG_12632 [Gaeumannomyces tritici R3-111a-1]EJT69749.1 hypothetical protein GGTG_12632 [Gaeumannomyces tritici R3-111a-1]